MTRALAPYYTGVNRDLLARIPITARHVLELGCGAGALGFTFRMRAPEVSWKGIELVPEAAEQARAVLDGVLQGDVEVLTDADLDAFLDGEAPDVLVFGDVLEHLKEPAAVLSRLVERLRPGGTVVACLPNVGHWSVIDHLLAGAWPQQDQGIFDRTHLRWFTLQGATALLRSAGLDVVKVRSRDFPLDAARRDQVLVALRPALERLGHSVDEASARMNALQYVLVATKPPARPVLQVHKMIMVPELMEARMDGPAIALASLPDIIVSRAVRSMSLPETLSEMPRIVLLQRQLVIDRTAWMDSITAIIRRGWLVVAEWDDHPELLPEPVRERWRLNPWTPFSGVHAVQVSTPLLRDALAEHNPEIAVLPNALLDVPPLPVRDGREPLRVVCAAMSRAGLADIVGRAIGALAAAHPGARIDIVADQALFDALPVEGKRFHPKLPYAEYLELLADSDISLMPIQGLPPERYKSPLKYMEGARSGAVCIGSPVLYSSVIRDGITGFLAEAPEHWEAALLRLAADGDLRRRMRRAAWEDVRKNHMQAGHIGARVGWYRELWERRQELHAALVRRHPDYAAVTF